MPASWVWLKQTPWDRLLVKATGTLDQPCGGGENQYDVLMTAAAEHQTPVGKAETIATWRKRGRMSVPTAAETLVDIWIVALYECTAVNGLPLDLLVEARRSRQEPVKRFGVLFCGNPPDWHRYPIPVLWLQEDAPGGGRWK